MKTKATNGTPATIEQAKQETAAQVNPPTSTPTAAPGAAQLLSGTPPEKLIALSGSIEERLQKIAQLNSLSNRREGIAAGIQRLAKFEFGHDQNSCKVVFTDAKGAAFESGNHETIKAVLNLLSERAKAELSRCDAEIFSVNL